MPAHAEGTDVLHGFPVMLPRTSRARNVIDSALSQVAQFVGTELQVVEERVYVSGSDVRVGREIGAGIKA